MTSCVHCDLPVGRRPVRATIDGAAEEFCCYGCVLARQVTRSSGEDGAAASALVRLGVAVFFAMNAMMVTLPAYVPAIYGADAGPVDGALFQVLRVLAMAFSAPVVVLLGGPILASAGRSLRAGVPNTDALIVLGTLAAYVLSVVHVLASRPEVYFDTVVMLLVLVTFGRYLEARARADAGEAVQRTLNTAPRRSLRVGAETDVGAMVDDAELRPGDLVRVPAGAAFPADGVVVLGVGGVDLSLLTGEHTPVLVQPGDRVAGGGSCIDGDFVVRLTAAAADSTEARIASMLAAARRQRTPAQLFADRVSAVMLPIVIATAAGAATYWTWAAGVDRGVLVALAVLCVACPCGLGLATPVAVWSALQTAARRGILARDPGSLERLAHVRAMFFDKTGTLTDRTPQLEAVHVEPGAGLDANELVRLAAAVENGQAHPVARALAAASALLSEVELSDVRVRPGQGVSARIDGVETTVGSLAFARADLGVDLAPIWPAGAVEIAVWQSRLLGRLCLRERPRAEAAAALRRLREIGVDLHGLTGDSQAAAIVPALLPKDRVATGLMPADKLERLQAARYAGGVAMVGDGVNDGPALAGADIGIAVGEATDLARSTADIVVMADDLRALPWLVEHSRRADAVIRQNLAWAFGYNGFAVALAAAGLLSPLVSTLAMIGSSLLVVANSRRLLRGELPSSASEDGASVRSLGSGAHVTRSVAPRSVEV